MSSKKAWLQQLFFGISQVGFITPRYESKLYSLSLAHDFGHNIAKFGNPDYCGDGPLSNLT